MRADPGASQTLVAGGFNFNTSSCVTTSCYYLGGYFRELSRIDPTPPDAIAIHPYLDVDYAALNGGDPLPPATSGLPSAQGAIEVIDQMYPSDPQIWLTEAGVWLTNSGKAGVTSVCGDGNPADDGTWLACLNGNPTAQALAAEGYLRLPSESSQITRVYYYDFNNQNVGWDSGLVNLNPGLAGAERIRHSTDGLVRAPQLRRGRDSGGCRGQCGAAGVGVRRPEPGRCDVCPRRRPALHRRRATGAGRGRTAR